MNKINLVLPCTWPGLQHRLFTNGPSKNTVFVSCVHWRGVEGSGVGSAGCLVYVDVHGECVMLWVAAT